MIESWLIQLLKNLEPNDDPDDEASNPQLQQPIAVAVPGGNGDSRGFGFDQHDDGSRVAVRS